jgi:Tol biopolymer transport system component
VAAKIGAAMVLIIAVGATLVISLALYLNSLVPQIDYHSGNKNQDRIVFSGRINSTTHQIFIVKPDGTGLANLTGGEDFWHFDPVPSPDGSKVAYEAWNSFPNSPLGGRIVQNLYIVNVDGADKVRLNSDDNLVTSSSFSWSPDSSRIAYESSEDIYVVNADGTNTWRLTHDGKPIGEGVRIDNHNPFWSDNTSIIFSSVTFRGIEPLTAQFRQINSDGTGLKSLFSFDLQSSGGYTWSNDRKNIAFLKLDDYDSVSLWVMDGSDNNERSLIDSSAFYSINGVGWSPDDTMISFVGIERAASAPNGEIYVVDVKDGDYRRLEGSESLNIIPVWSSDGSRIAFMKAIGVDAISINIIDVNTSEKTEVAMIQQDIVNQPLDWISVK